MILNATLSAMMEKCNKVFPKRNSIVKNDLTETLKPMDVILYRWGGKKDFIGGVLSYFTSSPYSHTGLHLKNSYSIEALSCGVGYRDISKYKGTIDVFRPLSLTREMRLIMFAKAAQSILEPYDYINLVFFPFMSVKEAVKFSGNHAFICSELISWIYKEAGVDLVKDRPEAIEAPADLGHSPFLNYIGSFRNTKRMKENFANKTIDKKVSELSKFVANFLKKFSLRDEYYKGLALNKEKIKTSFIKMDKK